jgi:small GTP-binding protein
MPANLPPQYFEAERKLKDAKTPQEKVSIFEELLSIVPKHKGTEKLQAQLKTKIAKLRSEIQKKPAIAKHGPTYRIEKSGSGQVVLIGPPNAGKSMLVKSISNADPEIGDYPFTTRNPAPAMMEYENIQIQLIDTPPVTPDYLEVWHYELVKDADGVLFILDLASQDSSGVLEAILAKLREKKIELIPEEQSIPLDSPFFLRRAIIVANKSDLPQAEENFNRLKKALEPKFHPLAISASRGDNLEQLKMRIFSLLHIIRVYSKAPGKKAEFEAPFTLKRGSSVLDMAKAVHMDFARKLKYARIWSKAKYQGQMVNRDHILEDEDIIELHI